MCRCTTTEPPLRKTTATPLLPHRSLHRSQRVSPFTRSSIRVLVSVIVAGSLSSPSPFTATGPPYPSQHRPPLTPMGFCLSHHRTTTPPDHLTAHSTVHKGFHRLPDLVEVFSSQSSLPDLYHLSHRSQPQDHRTHHSTDHHSHRRVSVSLTTEPTIPPDHHTTSSTAPPPPLHRLLHRSQRVSPFTRSSRRVLVSVVVAGSLPSPSPFTTTGPPHPSQHRPPLTPKGFCLSHHRPVVGRRFEQIWFKG